MVSAAADAAGGSWTATRSASVNDPEYHMAAFTLAVPAGWRFAAEVTRDPGCHGKGPSLKSTTASPDGQTAIAYLPGFRWQWTTSVQLRQSMQHSGCPGIDLDSAASFLVNIAVPNIQPKAAIVSVSTLDAAGQASLQSQLTQARHTNAAMAARYGMKPQSLSLDGARVRLRYSVGSKAMEEQIQTVVDCTESQMPALYKQPAYSQRQCSARNIYLVRAPQGHLDELLNSTALADLNKATHMNSDWLDRVQQDQMAAFKAEQAKNNQMFQSLLQKGQAEHAALMRQGEAFQKSEQEGFQRAQARDRATQAATDNAAHLQVLDSLGQKDFKNPNTGEVIQASSYYNHQWLSSDGTTLIQTDDTFDPNGVVYPVQQSWTELTPK